VSETALTGNHQIAYFPTTGLDRPSELIVRDPESWPVAWNRIHSVRRPAPPLPEVDFSTDIVIIVSLGLRRSGGYGIQIDGAFRDETGTLVTIVETEPGPGCLVTTEISSPVEIAVFPATAEPISFKRRVEIRDC
jgi:hypothetical protein